ncbi:MAG: 30S ribosomal protein S3, partial [Minisyncoccales bacterium]
ERVGERVDVFIFTAKPGFVIGPKGELVERLKQKIKNHILKGKSDLRIEIRDVQRPWVSAQIIAQWVALQLEKRMPYRKVLKQALEKATVNKEVKGVKIQVSGRLDGVEISRSEWMKKGSLPRTTLRADIDFAVKEAKTKVGIVGVKVWIYKGEKE